MHSNVHLRVTVLALMMSSASCGDSGSSAGTTDDAATTDTSITSDTPAVDSPATNCTSATTEIDKAVCAAQAFLATIPAAQLASVNLAMSDNTARTKWSNLPGTARPGPEMSELSTASQAPALALMGVVLSEAGVSDLTGVRAADDYLASLGGGGYGAGKYHVAIFGTPSSTGSWEVMFGGHHMAYNIAYVAGVGYPIPNHLGVEPKAAFTQGGATYQPMVDEGDAMLAIFGSLSSTELSSAYLTGQTFADVLIGPLEYGTGSSANAKAKYPSGSNRIGVLVSSLTTEQKALVTAAIGAWVNDYAPAIATSLVATYTTDAAYADTYVAFGGGTSTKVDPDVNGTYMRIDGPRAWIEVSCQNGVVVAGKTHYHSIFRDKQFDYAGTL